jgi:nucleotide-binding universal stress UspA family protein
MSFADVLLRVAPRGKDEFERLSVAVDFVQRLRARLNGVFVATNELTDSDHARALFERAVSRTSIETTWRVVDGQSSRALLFQARRSDLSILPLGAAIGGGPDCAPELVAFGSGRPAIILPAPANSMSIGHTVLVGWNDSRESARAVHDAMPILVAADKVVVLTVLDGDDLEPLADRRLVEHLRQHGVSVELARRHGEIAEEIAAEARRVDADLLVVGLHRMPEGSPNKLGYVSTRLVRAASLPVFVSS